MKSYIILITIVLVLALVHLFIFTGSIGLNYDLVKKKVAFQKLHQENRRLNYLLARGESLDKVENLAKTKLGMIYPESINYIIISSKEAE